MKKGNKVAAVLFITIVSLILILGPGSGSAAAELSDPRSTQAPAPVVMIALPWDDSTIRIPPPEQFRAALAPTAAFSINYLSAGMADGQGATCLAWNDSAKAAFTYAASVWATLINSSIPIRINACWANLGSPTTLGYSWSNIKRDFAGAPQSGTFYSSSLANALHGSDIDPSNPDTYITYNNGFSWYFGTDGLTPSGQYDFVSVVMHEMGHSLNFTGSMGYGTNRCTSSTYGCWGYGPGAVYPNIYDRFTENSSGQALLNTVLFPNPSAVLGSQLIGGNLYFNGTNANAANGGGRVKIYAPSTWSSGSSYSHLDYSTFTGTANRLMVYAINSASSIHDPGPVGLCLLKDVGWTINGACGSVSSNKTYLPLILKPAGPTPGFWKNPPGTERTEFYVSPDGVNVLEFLIGVNFEGCGTYNIWTKGSAPIYSNQFSFSGGLYASGTFDSATAAHGTTGLNSVGPICGFYWTGGPWSWSTTWQNSSQPTSLSADAMGYEFVDSGPPIKGAYTAIPVK